MLIFISLTLTLNLISPPQERKADVAIAVQEKILEALCGVSEDEHMKKEMLELLISG
jgi:hypothetical protein